VFDGGAVDQGQLGGRVDPVVGALHVAAAQHRHVERGLEPETVEAVEGRRARTGHECVLAAVEHKCREIAQCRRRHERAAVGVRSDSFEDTALDSASKSTGADASLADVRRRDRAVVTCRDGRQSADLVAHDRD
jgi:hypothetical protein